VLLVIDEPPSIVPEVTAAALQQVLQAPRVAGVVSLPAKGVLWTPLDFLRYVGHRTHTPHLDR
jgi:hypothetical protein